MDCSLRSREELLYVGVVGRIMTPVKAMQSLLRLRVREFCVASNQLDGNEIQLSKQAQLMLLGSIVSLAPLTKMVSRQAMTTIDTRLACLPCTLLHRGGARTASHS